MENTERFQGVVVFFDAKRGWGFLKPDSGEKDLFIHFSNIVAPEGVFKTLEAGQRVEYGISANHKGPQACAIKVIQ